MPLNAISISFAAVFTLITVKTFIFASAQLGSTITRRAVPLLTLLLLVCFPSGKTRACALPFPRSWQVLFKFPKCAGRSQYKMDARHFIRKWIVRR